MTILPYDIKNYNNSSISVYLGYHEAIILHHSNHGSSSLSVHELLYL